jgi:UDP-2,4-diacetamido-2,4,6-trideoxy-beta-L-altropyranose hydrolase
MTKQKIIFRADGGQHIGMGHFIRTLALAEMLKYEFYCIYSSQTPSVYQINEIEKVCHERIDLPSDDTHFSVFLKLLQGDEIVVLDNYYFTTEYQLAIKAKGCKLVCIDDMHDKHFVSDVIINHAEGITEFQYSAEKYTAFCLGYKFALLRPDYLSNVSLEITKQYSFLIMMGGADPYNLTAKIISMIQPLQFSLPIAVVVGAGYNNEHQYKLNNNIELFKGVESSKVFQLMQVAQLGIFPASTVAIEACAARLPFICGYFVDNQQEIYNGIKTNDLAFCIGNYLQVGSNDFYKAFEHLNQGETTKKMVEKQKILLDKKSAERFIKTFNNL